MVSVALKVGKNKRILLDGLRMAAPRAKGDSSVHRINNGNSKMCEHIQQSKTKSVYTVAFKQCMK